MGMTDISVRYEFSSFNFQSHLLVGVSERHTVGSESIYFFHREDRVIHGVVEDMFVHLNLVYYICSHLQTVFQFVKGRQEHLFYNLQVTEISAWQVVHDKCNLLWQSLYLIALCSDEFKHVRILFVWHYAAACCAFLRKSHE